MSTSNVSVSTMNSLFKEVYADEVENLIPERELITKTIPFVSADKQNGNAYVQPVILSRNHGVTFLGNGVQSSPRLNDPVAAVTDRAEIKGSGMIIRGLMDYQAATRAQQGGPAFVDGTSYLVESLTDSFAAAIEQVHFHGGLGLGKATAATAALGVNQVKIDLAEWAPAVWVGGEGMPIDIYLTSSGALVLSTEVTAVDITNQLLTLASVAGLADATNYTIYRRQSKGLEALGIHYILQATGNLFGIDSSVRGLWRANQYPVSSTQLSFPKIAEGIAIAYGRGLEGSIDLHVNSRVFAGMIPDFLTSRDTRSNAVLYSNNRVEEAEKYSHGAKALKFIINSVEVNLIANDYVKAGYAYGMAGGCWTRVGSSEMTFNLPDQAEGQYFRQLPDYASMELRAYSDQAIFCSRPAKNILFTGIDAT